MYKQPSSRFSMERMFSKMKAAPTLANGSAILKVRTFKPRWTSSKTSLIDLLPQNPPLNDSTDSQVLQRSEKVRMAARPAPAGPGSK